jgi:hypothetical protein
MDDTADFTDGSEAHTLAEQLRRYWAQRGYSIETRIEVAEAHNRNGSVHCVKSNLINGLPPNYRSK